MTGHFAAAGAGLSRRRMKMVPLSLATSRCRLSAKATAVHLPGTVRDCSFSPVPTSQQGKLIMIERPIRGGFGNWFFRVSAAPRHYENAFLLLVCSSQKLLFRL